MTKSLQDYVVSRELAEELKKAGYPQEACNHWQSPHDDKWGLYRSSGLLWREGSKYSYAAPLSDEILEQLPKTINLPNSKGVAFLETEWIKQDECHYDYRDGYGSVLDDLVAYPIHPHNWYQNTEALARLWLWCKAEGYIK